MTKFMPNQNTLYLKREASRETNYKIIGTGSGLREFANSLSAATGQLPSRIEKTTPIFLKGIHFEDADVKVLECYLSLQCEPNLDNYEIKSRKNKNTSVLPSLIIYIIVGSLVLVGIGTVIRWFLSL
jgi:hypothetical protein